MPFTSVSLAECIERTSDFIQPHICAKKRLLETCAAKYCTSEIISKEA
jgi:hypothetical protein